MRIDELLEREPFAEILCETLRRGWSTQHGTTFDVRPGDAVGQEWRMQPLLNAFCTRDVSAAPRQFLRDGFRTTPVARRAPAQWMLGTMLATPLGLRMTERPGFTVAPALPGAGHLLVVPGNRRVRVFDFSTGLVRVMGKPGYGAECIATEVALRTAGNAPLCPPLTAAGGDSSWFEERILDGYALPRCPRSLNPARAAASASTALTRWSAATRRAVDANAHIDALEQDLNTALALLASRFPDAMKSQRLQWLPALAKAARSVPRHVVAASHGDFQPGNIIVSRDGSRVWIIDWEHAGARTESYDAYVLTLRSRSSCGLAARLRDAVARRDQVLPFADASAWRAQLACWILEDLKWFASESLQAPLVAPSAGFMQYLSELDAFNGLGDVLAPQ